MTPKTAAQVRVGPDTERVVHEWEDGNRWIRARLMTFRGREYLDVRVWFEPQPGEALLPTKKGVAILVENIDELEAAISECRKALGPAHQSRRRNAA